MCKKRLKKDGRAFLFLPFQTDCLDMSHINITICGYLKAAGFDYFPIMYTSGGKKILGKVTTPNQILNTVYVVNWKGGTPEYFPSMATMDFRFSNLMVRH
jgi:hypothetical protein